ncbi:MAG: hypothetical protein ABIZ81_01145 [Opitutaceae bacterium]
MDLENARQSIESALLRMRALYLKPVFDEWMILDPAAKHGGVLAYVGPRVESFRPNLSTDVAPLRAMMEGRELNPGDFEFAQDAAGPRHDAIVKIGPKSFLVCNNTAKTMAELRADPQWLKAQAAFFELTEKFRADPLQSVN